MLNIGKSLLKIQKNSKQIIEKSLKLEIEYLTKYKAFFYEIFFIGSRI